MTASVAGKVSARREILQLGLPFTIGVLSASLQGVIDTAMMGRFGTRELAAVASGAAVFDVLSTVAAGSVVGYQILAARYAGREDGAGMRDSLLATVRLSCVVVLPLVALCVLFGAGMTSILSSGADQAGVAAIGGHYLAAIAPTLVITVAFTALTATFNAHKLVRHPMTAGLVVAGCNVLFDWLLIYGPGPFPRLGAVGNGLATTLAWLVGLAVLVSLAVRDRLWRRFRATTEQGPPDFETSVTKLAVPAMISTALDYLSTAVFFGIVGALGAASLGGSRIAFHVMVLIFGLGSAFSAAARILTGRALGAGDRGRIRETWRAGRWTLLPPAFAVGLLLILLRFQVASVFTSFPEVRAQVGDALLIVGGMAPLIAWNLSNVAVVRAFGHTKLDMYGNVLAAVVVQLPAAWLLGDVLGLGVPGAFGGMVAYWVTRGAVLEIWARRCVRFA